MHPVALLAVAGGVFGVGALVVRALRGNGGLPVRPMPDPPPEPYPLAELRSVTVDVENGQIFARDFERPWSASNVVNHNGWVVLQVAKGERPYVRVTGRNGVASLGAVRFGMGIGKIMDRSAEDLMLDLPVSPEVRRRNYGALVEVTPDSGRTMEIRIWVVDTPLEIGGWEGASA